MKETTDTNCLETQSPEEMCSMIRSLRTREAELERQNEMLLLAVSDSAREKKKLSQFMENSYDVLFTLDTEGRFIYASPTWERYFGYPVSDILGNSFALFVHPDDVMPCLEYLQKVLSGTYFKASPPYRVKHADGSWLWFEANGMPFVDHDGTTMFTAAAHEITERKLTEDTLRESDSRFNQLAEQSGTFVWEVDTKGLYTYISHVCEAVLGYRPVELVGKIHFYDLHPESERELFKAAAFEAFERNEPFHNFENSALTKHNRLVWLSTNGIPLLSDDGTLLGYRGSDTDITEHRKLKEQLIQSQKMEAVGQLAGGLAHDFNNVLSIINGYCCLLQMDMGQEDPQNDYVERILAASGRAGELTHSMLAFSRTQVMKPQNQNLNMIVSNVATFVKRIIGEDIQFKTVQKETSLPVYVDGGQIEQILINLANNARDAMPNGGKLTITTELLTMGAQFILDHDFGEPGRYAVITVSDTGRGIDKIVCKKIFEPFFTTKEVGKGTGLGLAMVYGITKQHNGFVDVSSEPGQGARFMIYLPIVGMEQAGSDTRAAAVEEAGTGTETILVVEDDLDLREFMQKMLVKLGYRVILAVDGQDAVEKFSDNAETIQLIIMDMIMPRKSGTQAYDEIRQIKPNVKALFSSGYNARTIQHQEELGVHAEFIAKPVQPRALFKKVREILDR